ncbi:hypothetical protein KSF_108860 [Reticulibacter mediterranei]|uniref:Response regulatory domain-containing protein n=1 Tax=Reticulibacter mediterranei TaxID=2778369 RepID=A0A8J3N9I8_9CHLR|nr:response regulator [Reticulibacter mediterranei]GHP00839.1 hypothetical protein KSF_108860 [Reticulibacter mediterranei]
MLPKSIWVIDDSPTVRTILQGCLTREGFTVHAFHDGIEALRLLNRLLLQQDVSALPVLALVDLGLPLMDGYAVIRYLKEHLPSIICIIVSRRNGEIDRLLGWLAGASFYITKPFRPSDIIQVVSDQLGIITVKLPHDPPPLDIPKEYL